MIDRLSEEAHKSQPFLQKLHTAGNNAAETNSAGLKKVVDSENERGHKPPSRRPKGRRAERPSGSLTSE